MSCKTMSALIANIQSGDFSIFCSIQSSEGDIDAFRCDKLVFWINSRASQECKLLKTTSSFREMQNIRVMITRKTFQMVLKLPMPRYYFTKITTVRCKGQQR